MGVNQVFKVKNKETNKITTVYTINYEAEETMFFIYDDVLEGWYWDYADKYMPAA